MPRLSRRGFILLIFAAFVAIYEALVRVPKRWFMWLVVGRRLDSERKILDGIASDLPDSYTFPCGEEKARVVLARNRNLKWHLIHEFAPGGWMGIPDQEQVSEIVDRAVLALTNKDSIPAAYAGLFRPDDRVAIKVIWTSYLEVLDPIIRGLLSIGIPADRITLFEYRQAKDRWWDPTENPTLREPLLLGRGSMYRFFNEFKYRYNVSISGGRYHPQQETIGSQKCRLEQCLVDCTALINVASLKTHYLADTTMSLKNHQGSHDSPHFLHASWDVSIALLNHIPAIREKTRLVVCDATAPVYNMGPETRNNIYTWPYNGILVSRDPVALDSVGLSILKEKRKKEGFHHQFHRTHDQLRNAERLRLGRHQPEWIDFVEILTS